jgi:hypothetical protein
VSAQAKREYVQAIYQRYRQASRPDKQRILDEFCQVAHYHRKYAIRLLNGPAPGAARPPRRRAATYGAAVIEALVAIWEAAGYPWSVRLKALLPLWLPWARRRRRLRPAVERALLAISPRQMDRRLAPHRRRLTKRLYGRTKPGTLLKHHIPLRTDRWDVATAGFTEVDLVAHCGSLGDGEFIHSLNLTDIHTTWVETAAVLGKSQAAVQAALEELARSLTASPRRRRMAQGSRAIAGPGLAFSPSRRRRRRFLGDRPGFFGWAECPPPGGERRLYRLCATEWRGASGDHGASARLAPERRAGPGSRLTLAGVGRASVRRGGSRREPKEVAFIPPML